MNSNKAVKQTEGNIIEIQKLEKHFRSGGNEVKAVDGVTVRFPSGKMIACAVRAATAKPPC